MSMLIQCIKRNEIFQGQTQSLYKNKFMHLPQPTDQVRYFLYKSVARARAFPLAFTGYCSLPACHLFENAIHSFLHSSTLNSLFSLKLSDNRLKYIEARGR